LQTVFGELRVVSTEGLIGLKVREYFRLFNRESLLEELLQ